MSISTEEFFMILTIGLIVIIPVSVRLHRYLTRGRATKMLREQFTQQAEREGSHGEGS